MPTPDSSTGESPISENTPVKKIEEDPIKKLEEELKGLPENGSSSTMSRRNALKRKIAAASASASQLPGTPNTNNTNTTVGQDGQVGNVKPVEPVKRQLPSTGKSLGPPPGSSIIGKAKIPISLEEGEEDEADEADEAEEEEAENRSSGVGGGGSSSSSSSSINSTQKEANNFKTLTQEISRQSEIVTQKKEALLDLINKQPMEKRPDITKLLTVSSQQSLGNYFSNIFRTNEYYNFVGKLLMAEDKNRTLSSPVDDKAYAHRFWGEESRVKTGKIFQKGNESDGVNEMLRIIYEMYSTAGVSYYKKFGQIEEFFDKIDVIATIKKEFNTHGYHGTFFTNSDGVLQAYSEYFDEIIAALIEVATELILLKILQERLKNVPAPELPGYTRFRNIIDNSHLAMAVGIRMAVILGLKNRSMPFHYYLDEFLQTNDTKIINKVINGIVGILEERKNLYKGENTEKGETQKKLEEYLTNHYLEEDLNEMRRTYNKNKPYRTIQNPSKPVSGKEDRWDLSLIYTSINQGGGARGKDADIPNAVLTLLLIGIKSYGNEHDPDTYVKKAKRTINDIGQLPLVKEFIGKLLTSIEAVPNSDGYTFSPFEENVGAIEEALHNNFSESEISVLKGLSVAKVLYSSVPEEYEAILGEGAYSLDGSPKDSDETPLSVSYASSSSPASSSETDDNIVLTKEERRYLETGGVPVGALMFLYFVCLKESKYME